MIRRILESPNYRWWAFAAVALGNFFSSMEQGALVIAIPSISSHFNADIPTGQWVYLAYFLTISAALLPSGRLSDVLGRKRVYVAGLLLFILGGAMASLAPSLVLVMIAKAIQGVGTGAMTANMMAIPVAVFPAKARGQSLGLFSALGSVGVVLGPVVGGSLVTAAGWRYAFLVPVALAVVTTVFVVLVLDDRRISVARRDGSRPRFDSSGAMLSVVGLFVLLLALSRGQSVGWLSPWILAGAGSFAVLLAAFIAWELRSASPLLDVRLFRRRTFSLGTTARAVFMFTMSSPAFLLPFYLQGVAGLTAGRAGVVMLTSSVAMVLTSPFCGLLSDRVGRKPFMAAGLVLVATGFFLLSRATASQASVWLVVGGLALQGAGSGAFIAPNLSTILGATEREKHGVTTALVNLVRTASNLTGVAIATAIVSGVMVWVGHEPRLDAAATAGAGDAFVQGMRYAFLAMASIAALGVLACLTVDERRDRVEG